MSTTSHWREQFVTFDSDGAARLERAASRVVASLENVADGPRSEMSALELHAGISGIEVCPDEGVGLDVVIEELRSMVWTHGVVPSDPACVAHLHPPTLLPAVVTELSIAATNQSMDSWDQSPAATEVELLVLRWLARLVGFDNRATGVMTSGGTASNLLAMLLARSWRGTLGGADVLQGGLPPEASTWRILGSDQAHFSLQRAAAQLGLGRDSVITVASTPEGVIDLVALDATLEELAGRGLRVLALVATAGTTDLGAIDDLRAIGERARRVEAWFHVDAAVAGAFLLSPRLRARLAGIEDADSVTVDFHKLWWQPFNASALVVADGTRCQPLRVTSNYLDRGDELDGVVNLVGRSLDTSRRFDAAKVLATLRSVGRTTMAAMLEHLVALATYAGELVDAHPLLELVATPTSVTCVFDSPVTDADGLRRVQQNLLVRGDLVLGRTVIKGRAALKFTFMNPLTTTSDVERLIDVVAHEISELT